MTENVLHNILPAILHSLSLINGDHMNKYH